MLLKEFKISYLKDKNLYVVPIFYLFEWVRGEVRSDFVDVKFDTDRDDDTGRGYAYAEEAILFKDVIIYDDEGRIGYYRNGDALGDIEEDFGVDFRKELQSIADQLAYEKKYGL